MFPGGPGRLAIDGRPSSFSASAYILAGTPDVIRIGESYYKSRASIGLEGADSFIICH